MKIIKKSFVLFIILTFTLSPLNFQGIFSYFTQAQTAEGTTESIISWSENKTIENSIIINPSETLTIKKGITITFKENASLEIRGKLIAKGTITEPIKFRGENNDANYSIKIFGSGEVIMRSVDISGGGMYGSWHLVHKPRNC